MDIVFAVKFFGALFAVMNPFLTLPIFLAMTAGEDIKKQRLVALQIVLYSAIMCFVVAIAGNHILSFFGVSINHFRVAGGMVLMGIAFSMLNGKDAMAHTGSPTEKKHLNYDDHIAFYPLTFPMIVGPGTITTLILYVYQAQLTSEYLGYSLVVLSILVIMYVILFFASSIGHILSNKMRAIMTRVMGMLLAAIAVSMIVAGLNILMPGLAQAG